MNDAEFHRLATETLRQIEHAIETCGVDIDFENVSDILTLEFTNGSKIIINKQGAAHQLWVAARSGGFHYRYDTASHTWRNEQNQTEMMTELTRLVSAQAGEPVNLA
jgi:CyaY protein